MPNLIEISLIILKFFYEYRRKNWGILVDALQRYFSPLGATAPIWALAYLHETPRFTSVY
jgi:hypothetical protein